MRCERLDVEVVLAAERAELRDEELDLTRPEPAQQLVPVAHHHAHDDTRVIGHEPGERVGEHGLGGERAATHMQVAALQTAFVHQVTVEVVGELCDLADPGDEDVAAVGRLDAGRRADEQAAADFALHRLDAARER